MRFITFQFSLTNKLITIIYNEFINSIKLKTIVYYLGIYIKLLLHC